MSPKDISEFSTDIPADDDVIELTDIVEEGSVPAGNGKSNALFDMGNGTVDFEKELEDLFADDAGTNPPADGLDFEADLDDLLGNIDKGESASAQTSGSGHDDFAAELDDLLGDAVAPTAQAVTASPSPAAPHQTSADDDNLADLDALLDDLDGHEASGPSVPPAAQSTAPDMDELDALINSMSSSSAAPSPLHDTDDDSDLPDLSDLDALLASHTDDLDPADNAEVADIMDEHSSSGNVNQAAKASTPPVPPAAPKPQLFDPNEALDAPDMGDLDALLEDLGLDAAPDANDDIPDLDALLVQDMGPETAPPTAEPASPETDLPGQDATPSVPDAALSDMPEADSLAESLPHGTPKIDSFVSDDLENVGDLEGHLPQDELPELPEPSTQAEADAPPSPSVSPKLEADTMELRLEPDGESTFAADIEALRNTSPDTAAWHALLARVSALEEQHAPIDEHVEDIVSRKLAENAAEDEACAHDDLPGLVARTLDAALAEDGPIMARITAIVGEQLNARVAELEQSVFTHKDWNTLSVELKDGLAASLEKSAAKAAADVIREELTALLADSDS